MKKVALEDLMINCILSFCENLAELGCPRDAEPDMWFRELSYDEQVVIIHKLMAIEERNKERYNDENK